MHTYIFINCPLSWKILVLGWQEWFMRHSTASMHLYSPLNIINWLVFHCIINFWWIWIHISMKNMNTHIQLEFYIIKGFLVSKLGHWVKKKYLLSVQYCLVLCSQTVCWLVRNLTVPSKLFWSQETIGSHNGNNPIKFIISALRKINY